MGLPTILPATIILLALYETLRPMRHWKETRIRRAAFHLSIFAANESVFYLAVAPFQVRLLSQNTNFVGLLAHSALPSWLKFALAFVLLDLAGYWMHRAYHASHFLWALHEVHHSDVDMDFTSAFRNHFGQTVFSSIFEVGLAALLGIIPAHFSAYLFIRFFQVHFHHANIKLPRSFSWAAWFWILPASHVLHHRRSRSDHDKNYGTFFSFWDRVFGTYIAPAEGVPMELGTGMKTSLDFRNVILSPFGKMARYTFGTFLFFSTACTKPPTPDLVSPRLTEEIEYGRQLFIHTAKYLGPKGTVSRITKSRKNCQNCHLDGGMKPYGFSLVESFSRYPDYRAREGRVITLAERINNCFVRPMLGTPLPLDGKEMRALMAYFRHLGTGSVVGFKKEKSPFSTYIRFPSRAADPRQGAALYTVHCANCHGNDGLGKLDASQTEFVYPPLWGAESFASGSNMFRVTKLAAFLKANMPLGATWTKPLLTDEQAFDLAAFISDDRIHPRPMIRGNDYPTVSEKPFDYSIGPYSDRFSEQEHKFGPYGIILDSLRAEGKTPYY